MINKFWTDLAEWGAHRRPWLLQSKGITKTAACKKQAAGFSIAVPNCSRLHEYSADKFRNPCPNSFCAGLPAHDGWPASVLLRNRVLSISFHRFGYMLRHGWDFGADTGRSHTRFWWEGSPADPGKSSAGLSKPQSSEGISPDAVPARAILFLDVVAGKKGNAQRFYIPLPATPKWLLVRWYHLSWLFVVIRLKFIASDNMTRQSFSK